MSSLFNLITIMKNSIFVFLCLTLLFSACEKENFAPEILPDSPQQTVEKAEEDCNFNDFTNLIRRVEVCGVEYDFHASLQLLNQGGIHRIQAYAKCYKRGGDPSDIIDFAKMEIIVSGDMHIWCQLPFDLAEASDYNENLVNGQVPLSSHCDDCGDTIVNLDYVKNVTLTDNDKIKAIFLLKIEDCGEIGEAFIDLALD